MSIQDVIARNEANRAAGIRRVYPEHAIHVPPRALSAQVVAVVGSAELLGTVVALAYRGAQPDGWELWSNEGGPHELRLTANADVVWFVLGRATGRVKPIKDGSRFKIVAEAQSGTNVLTFLITEAAQSSEPGSEAP